jgi:hypothetical protein
MHAVGVTRGADKVNAIQVLSVAIVAGTFLMPLCLGFDDSLIGHVIEGL